MAATLAENSSLREEIKQEGLKKFDGDYDILYKRFVNKHTNFKDKLTQNVKVTAARVSSDAVISGAVVPSNMEAILQEVPNLNISIPVNIEKWNTSTTAPLVTFVPVGFDERKTKLLKAFDKDGQVHWLDAQKAPDFPVIVVGASERVVVDPATKKLKYANLVDINGISLSNKTSPSDGIGTNIPRCDDPTDDQCYDPRPPRPPLPPTTPPTPKPCRVDKQTEYLRGMWFKDISYYEAWILGQPEIQLTIKTPVNDQQKYFGNFTESRNVMSDNWWYLYNDLLYWDQATLGNTLVYIWNEDDGGFKVDYELTVGFKIAGVSFSNKITYSIKNDDDFIGTKLVQQESCPPEYAKYYSLGGGNSEFRFQTYAQ